MSSSSKPVILQRPPQRWACPNCQLEDVTPAPKAGTAESRFHPCAGLKGLTAPMLPAGMDAKVEALEWGDMLHGELAQRDGDGRPVSAIVTTRADGSNDTAVLAPTARMTLD